MKYKNFILLIGLVFIFLFGCIDIPQEEITYANYSDDYFSINYPDNWDAKTETVYGVVMNSFQSKLENTGDSVQDGLLVEIYEANDEFQTIEDFEEFETNLIYEAEEVLSSSEILFKGHNAFELESTMNDPELGELRLYSVLFKVDDKVFRIAYFYEVEKEEFLSIFEEMLESFEVNYEYIEKPVLYEEYSNELFSIIYPDNWDVAEEYYEEGPTVSFASKLESSYDLMRDGILLETYALKDGFSTLEDFELLELALLYEGEEILSNQVSTFKEYDSFEMKTQIYDPYYEATIKYIYLYLLIPEKNVTLRISQAYESKKESKYLPIFEEMLDSLEIH